MEKNIGYKYIESILKINKGYEERPKWHFLLKYL